VVQITAVPCAPLARDIASLPSVFFHDSYNRTKAGAQSGQGYRIIPRHQVGNVVSAEYQVRPDDSTGPGLFVVFCGDGQHGQGGDASFTVIGTKFGP